MGMGSLIACFLHRPLMCPTSALVLCPDPHVTPRSSPSGTQHRSLRGQGTARAGVKGQHGQQGVGARLPGGVCYQERPVRPVR